MSDASKNKNISKLKVDPSGVNSNILFTTASPASTPTANMTKEQRDQLERLASITRDKVMKMAGIDEQDKTPEDENKPSNDEGKIKKLE